jgi:ribosomal protein S27AE
MVFHLQPTDPWTRGDFKLLEAYEILKKETCGKCGGPVWLCRHEDSDLQWEVRTSVCKSDKAVNQWVSRNRKDKGLSDGETAYAVPFMLRFEDDGITPIEDFDNLPTREDFYKAKAEVTNSE